MSPEQFKRGRERFEMTQTEFASCLGLTQKTVSQYEIGFRKPGPTVQVIMFTLEALSDTQAKKLLELMRDVSDKLSRKRERRSR